MPGVVGRAQRIDARHDHAVHAARQPQPPRCGAIDVAHVQAQRHHRVARRPHRDSLRPARVRPAGVGRSPSRTVTVCAASVAHHLQARQRARAAPRDFADDLVVVRHALVVDAGDEIVGAQSRAMAGRAAGHVLHERALRRGEPQRALQVGIDVRQRHAHVAARHPPFGLELRENRSRFVDRHREADVARPLADRRVDADDFAAAVDERPAAVAEVDRGVGLNVVVEAAVEQLAPEVADDPDRDGVLVRERIADGAHPLAHAQRFRVSHRRDRQVLRVDLDQRDVGVGIDAEHARLQAAAIGELHHDPLGVLDHVVVRQDLSVASMTNPLPDCGRTALGLCGAGLVSSNGLGSAPRRRRLPARVVASMLTTAGLRLSATSAKFTSPGAMAAGRLSAGAAAAGSAGKSAGSRRARRRKFHLRRRRVGRRRRAQAARGDAEQKGHHRRQRQRDEGKGPEHSENYKPTSFRNAASSSTEMPSASAFASLLPGIGAGHDVVGLLADRAGDFSAARLDRFGGRFARHRRERAGQDERLAAQRSGRRRGGHRRVHLQPRGGELSDERLVLRLVEIFPNGGGDDGADVGHGLKLLFRRGQQRVHRAERAGQRLRAALADMADAEAVNQPPEIARLAALDLCDEIGGRLLAHALDVFERSCVSL